MKVIIVIAILLTPTNLSSIKPAYRPHYPVCIMSTHGTRYLLQEPGGEVKRYE